MRVLGHLLIAVLTVGALSGCTVSGNLSGNGCTISDQRNATVRADTVKRVVIDAGAGDLRVEGRPDLTEIQVRGTACATTEELFKQIDLRVEQDGDTVTVKAILPRNVSGHSPYLDLTVQLPESMVVRITDTSGDIRAENLAEIDVADDSGQMELRNIRGMVRVTDDSGDIEIEGVSGYVMIPNDDSGSIRVSDVRGDVGIDRDDSGDIDIHTVGGDVLIASDQSGEIKVTGVTGGVHIADDDSGSIAISGVGKDVRIDRDDSGGIDVRDVQGDFRVGRDGSGDIQYSGVQGTVSVPRK